MSCARRGHSRHRHRATAHALLHAGRRRGRLARTTSTAPVSSTTATACAHRSQNVPATKRTCASTSSPGTCSPRRRAPRTSTTAARRPPPTCGNGASASIRAWTPACARRSKAGTSATASATSTPRCCSCGKWRPSSAICAPASAAGVRRCTSPRRARTTTGWCNTCRKGRHPGGERRLRRLAAVAQGRARRHDRRSLTAARRCGCTSRCRATAAARSPPASAPGHDTSYTRQFIVGEHQVDVHPAVHRQRVDRHLAHLTWRDSLVRLVQIVGPTAHDERTRQRGSRIDLGREAEPQPVPQRRDLDQFERRLAAPSRCSPCSASPSEPQPRLVRPHHKVPACPRPRA